MIIYCEIMILTRNTYNPNGDIFSLFAQDMENRCCSADRKQNANLTVYFGAREYRTQCPSNSRCLRINATVIFFALHRKMLMFHR